MGGELPPNYSELETAVRQIHSNGFTLAICGSQTDWAGHGAHARREGMEGGAVLISFRLMISPSRRGTVHCNTCDLRSV